MIARLFKEIREAYRLRLRLSWSNRVREMKDREMMEMIGMSPYPPGFKQSWLPWRRKPPIT